MSKKRECENWLTSFLEWTLPNSEAPESFLVWSGLFCIAAVLKRRVRWSKNLIKQWDVYPTTYLMFVAPPGVAKKSTTAGYAEKVLFRHNELLGNVTDPGYVNFGPTSGSDVRMIQKMSETVDGSMCIVAGEFGNIVKTRAPETYDFFTKMFDNDPYYVHDTLSNKGMTVMEPSLNLLGCTTPDWMAANSGYITGGGFAARTVFIFEQFARQRKLFDKEITLENGKLVSKDLGLPPKELEKMQERLAKDLGRISKIEGEAEPETLALAKRMEEWYRGYIDKPTQRGEETFHQRKHLHALKTAMLLSVCERDDLIVTEEHFDAALVLVNYVEKRLSRGFAIIGHNPYSGAYYKVLDYIQSKGKVKRGQVLAYFFNDIPLEELEKIFVVLKAAGEIEFVTTTEEFRVIDG